MFQHMLLSYVVPTAVLRGLTATANGRQKPILDGLTALFYGPEVAALIQRELGQRTVALDPLAAFGTDQPAPEGAPTEALAACIPLLGAALRAESRQL